MTTHTPTDEYRVTFEYEREPDLSWLEQSMYDPASKDYEPGYRDEAAQQRGEPLDPDWYRNPDNHLTLCAIAERRCGECGHWSIVGSLGNIDFFADDREANQDVDNSYTESLFGRIHNAYLRDVAADLVSEARAERAAEVK